MSNLASGLNTGINLLGKLRLQEGRDSWTRLKRMRTVQNVEILKAVLSLRNHDDAGHCEYLLNIHYFVLLLFLNYYDLLFILFLLYFPCSHHQLACFPTCIFMVTEIMEIIWKVFAVSIKILPFGDITWLCEGLHDVTQVFATRSSSCHSFSKRRKRKKTREI